MPVADAAAAATLNGSHDRSDQLLYARFPKSVRRAAKVVWGGCRVRGVAVATASGLGQPRWLGKTRGEGRVVGTSKKVVPLWNGGGLLGRVGRMGALTERVAVEERPRFRRRKLQRVGLGLLRWAAGGHGSAKMNSRLPRRTKPDSGAIPRCKAWYE